MSLFHPYTKEGKGVEKREERPIRPLYFFEIFGRKFWKLIQLNLLYIALTFPVWIAVGLLIFNDKLLTDFSFGLIGGFLRILAYVFIIFSPLIGPATAGMTYVLKSFAREEPIFVFSDFFEHAKKNFKQSTLLTVINGIFMLSFSFTLTGGDSLLFAGGSTTLSTLQLPLLIVNLILIFVNYYAFSIMVMFEQKFMDLIKNSFIFALAKLPLNLFILIIICAVCYFAYHYLVIGLLLTLVLLYAFSGFLVVFSVYPTIEKHMLIPALKLEKASEETL